MLISGYTDDMSSDPGGSQGDTSPPFDPHSLLPLTEMVQPRTEGAAGVGSEEVQRHSLNAPGKEGRATSSPPLQLSMTLSMAKARRAGE